MLITVKANAKINLTLDVTGINSKGYHLLDSVFQSIDLSDIVTVKIGEGEGVCVTSTDAHLSGEQNIAHKAATQFLNAIGKKALVEITIKKCIPVASGMGGGSADAAATLLALNKLYGEPLSKAQLSRLALNIGADVPFCLEGGTMRAKGIGEELSPLPALPDCYIVVIKDSKKPSTKEMYSRLDAMKNLDRPDNEAFIKALKLGNYKKACSNMKNVFSCLWDNGYLEELIACTSPDATVLSGSGPTVTAFFDEKSRADMAIKLLKTAGIECYLSTPLKKAYSFE